MSDEFGNKKTSTFVWVAILWVISFILGLAAIEALVNLSQLAFMAGGMIGREASRASSGLVLLIGIGYLVVAIGTFEFHRKHYGEAKSWRLMAIVFFVEAALVLANMAIERMTYGA